MSERKYVLNGKYYTLYEASKRIAELEAELASHVAAAKKDRRGWKAVVASHVMARREAEARAENAEAGVERLRARIRLAVLANDVKDLRPIALYEGGGRESGESGLAPGVEVANHGNAAANPAAPQTLEWDCEHNRKVAAARKERDEG